MAKGNLFLGQGRGKVGDVVFYRMNGWQMARVRNRTPKNPRSNEQLYQRAVIATIMKAYSAGKEIFDHSFQGYTIGEGCMRRFNSVNARILRSQLVDDISKNKPANKCLGRFVAPRALTSTPCIGLQVSEGTLINNLFITKEQTTEIATFKHFEIAPSPIQGITTINQYLESMKIYPGDIFTFVKFIGKTDNTIYNPNWSTNNFSKQFETEFYFQRLIVKSDIPDTLTLANAKYKDIFEEEINNRLTYIDINEAFTPGSTVNFVSPTISTFSTTACIRSRLDVDLRSTAYLELTSGKEWGITSNYVLTAWQDEVEKVGESELILEGGDGPSLQPMSIDDEEPIIPAPVNESPVPIPARHRGTRNNPR